MIFRMKLKNIYRAFKAKANPQASSCKAKRVEIKMLSTSVKRKYILFIYSGDVCGFDQQIVPFLKV